MTILTSFASLQSDNVQACLDVSCLLCRELSKYSRSDAGRRMSDQDQSRLRNSDGKAASSASSLITIFKEVPQKVLAICMRGLQKGHGDFYHGSKRFMSETLLRSSQADTASIPDSLGRFFNDAKDTASSDCSIAAQVLQTMPNVQHWINETISSLSKGAETVALSSMCLQVSGFLKCKI